jgi:outer membrane protein OmpU
MTKKLLLGSTALVAGGLMAAPAMAADPIKIGLGGYYQFFVNAGAIEGVYALNGNSLQYKGLSFYQEGEIYFNGQTKLDNGTTIGLQVELEGWNPPISNSNPNSAGVVTGGGSTSQIDEAYLFAFGDWGRIEFGSRDQATYRMFYGAPSAVGVYLGFFQHNSNATWIGAAGSVNKAAQGISFFTIGGQMQDVNRINYYTPRFMGLQIGVGYAPKVNTGGSLRTGGPGIVGVCGFNDAQAQAVCPTNDYSWQNFVDVGANYLNKFGDVTVAVFGAWMYAQFVPGYSPLASQASLVTGANNYDWTQWVVGLQFGYAGFTVGGSYGYDNLGLGSNYYTGVDNANRKFSAGIMYETGPWQMSFGWGYVVNNNGNGSASALFINPGTSVIGVAAAASSTFAFGTNTNTGALQFGAEQTNKFEVGASYALGPGIKVLGGGVYYNVSGPSNLTAQQSWQLFLGMDLRF